MCKSCTDSTLSTNKVAPIRLIPNILNLINTVAEPFAGFTRFETGIITVSYGYEIRPSEELGLEPTFIRFDVVAHTNGEFELYIRNKDDVTLHSQLLNTADEVRESILNIYKSAVAEPSENGDFEKTAHKVEVINASTKLNFDEYKDAFVNLISESGNEQKPLTAYLAQYGLVVDRDEKQDPESLN